MFRNGPLEDSLKNLDPKDAENLRALIDDDETSPGFEATVLAHDSYDIRLLAEFAQSSEAFRNLAYDPEAPETFKPLLIDLFLAYFKTKPTLADGFFDPWHAQANRPIIQRVLDDPQTMTARIHICLDELASGLAAIEAGKAILDQLKNRPALTNWLPKDEEDKEPLKNIKLQGGPQPDPSSESQSQGDSNKASHGQSAGSTDSENGQPSRTGRNRLSEGEPERSSSDNIGTPNGPSATPPATPPAIDLTETVEAGVNAGAEEARDFIEALAGWGLEPRDLRRAPLGERVDLARKLRTRRVKDLARMLGRLKDERARVEAQMRRSDAGEPAGTALSGDPRRALPAERISAFGSGNPDREMDFYRKLSEGTMPSRATRRPEPQGHGSVIAMIDASGSMGGTNMTWASSLALALTRVGPGSRGRNQDSARTVRAIFFNAQIVLELLFESCTQHPDIEKLISLATVDASGGTQYTPPLERALAVLDETKNEPGPPPDLLLVTDARCKIDESLKARLATEKKKLGFKLVSVVIGAGRTGDLPDFSDIVIRASHLAQSPTAAATTVFESLLEQKA